MKCTDCKFYENECESHFQLELIGRKRNLEICEMFFPKEPIFIEANMLIEDVKAAEANGGMGTVVARTLIRYVRRQKTVDAVGVVRCKDCTKRIYDEYERLYWCAECDYSCNNAKWFCAGGERKTDVKE